MVSRRTFLRGSLALAASAVGSHALRRLPRLGPVPEPVGGIKQGLTAAWIAAENAKPGTDEWLLRAPDPVGTIEGYLDHVSAALGDTVAFKVSTVRPEYQILGFRMGWYQGLGARKVWESPTLPGRVQAAPLVDRETNRAEAVWETTYELTLDPKTFLPGCYLFRLNAADADAHVPLTIRVDDSNAPFLMVNAVTSWQAYNKWGGASLYWGRTRHGETYAARARVVSFDRPYVLGAGGGDFAGNELPLVMRLEQQAFDVTYLTSLDVHADPSRLLRHKAILSPGHDEYWSLEMRNGTEAARDQGINLAFLGANACFRQIRFEDSPLGPNRRQVCYKEAREDPLRRTDPRRTTVDWRYDPVDRPEASMIGVQYDGQPVRAALVVTDPDAWMFEGTGAYPGMSHPGVIGPEYDTRYPGSSPENLQVLAHSPVVVGVRPSHADTSYYTAPSGAGVFASGTIWWIGHLHPVFFGIAQSEFVHQTTLNVLRAFGEGPAGRTYPAIPNTPAAGKNDQGGAINSPAA